MRKINVLSLDLDWFNFIYDSSELENYIDLFFYKLKKECYLPNNISLITEHHYLYPWICRLLKKKNAQKVDIVNVDQHHDFYNADDIKRFSDGVVDCGNFFLYMCYKNLLNSYIYLTNEETQSNILSQRNDAIYNLRKFKKTSKFVTKFKAKGRKSVFEVLSKKKFDGFAIIQSLDYTHNRNIVFKKVEECINKYFSWDKQFYMTRNTQTKNFNHNRLKKILPGVLI